MLTQDSEQKVYFHEWIRNVIGGGLAPVPPFPVGLWVRRHDYHHLRMNRSSRLNTPLKIGDRGYQHGLGTHATSEIVVNAGSPVVKFEAEVGIDNNCETCGRHGTVEFIVEAVGKTLFDSGIRRGSDSALSLCLPMEGAGEFTLIVTDAGDGIGHDHADWANARVTLCDGRRIWLDELPVVSAGARLEKAFPFSFSLDGVSSASFLSAWKIERRDTKLIGGKESHLISFSDPATGLVIEWEADILSDYPAAEWLLRVKNNSSRESQLIENILPLDLRMEVPCGRDIVLHHSRGSICGADDFIPLETEIKASQETRLAAANGRASGPYLPFFNLRWPFGGLLGAIGWSGQWAMSVKRDDLRQVQLSAGQETTRLRLLPGESMRTPRILLVSGDGLEYPQSQNLFRKVILAHHTPKHNGVPVTPPIAYNSWFSFNEGNEVTEGNQLDAIENVADLGVEAFWLDAGWSEGGWPNGAGTWEAKAGAFPRGLKPLADAAHRRGMKFVVWFEPERVHAGSLIHREHPEWLLPPARSDCKDHLFNLGNPEARKWLTDLLSKRISGWGIDILRIDFNIEPLQFWKAADAPDRQGAAESHYNEGLYAMWDELLARHPGLAIDNCASGGRRIDLETMSRSIALWRSDTQCSGSNPVQDQIQTAGLSLYVPLHSAGCWDFEPYPFRSVATMGASISSPSRSFPDSTDAIGDVKEALREIKELRECYLGDFYQLVPVNADERQWCAWQFDRPDLGRGFAVYFRRRQSPYAALAGLKGLDRKARYEVVFKETCKPGKSIMMGGDELIEISAEIARRPGVLLITYGKCPESKEM